MAAYRKKIPCTILDTLGNALTFATNAAQATVYLRNADGTPSATPATVYSDEQSGTTLSQPLHADSSGRIPGWLARGRYVATCSATAMTSYNEPIDSGVVNSDDTIDFTGTAIGIGQAANSFRLSFLTSATNTDGIDFGGDMALYRAGAGHTRFESTGVAAILGVNTPTGSNAEFRISQNATSKWSCFFINADGSFRIRSNVIGGAGGDMIRFFGAEQRIDLPQVATDDGLAAGTFQFTPGVVWDVAGAAGNYSRIRMFFPNGITGGINSRGAAGDATNAGGGNGDSPNLTDGSATFFLPYQSNVPFSSKGSVVANQVDLSLNFPTGATLGTSNYNEGRCYVGGITTANRGANSGAIEVANFITAGGNAGPARARGIIVSILDKNLYSAYTSTVFGAGSAYINRGSVGLDINGNDVGYCGTGLLFRGGGGTTDTTVSPSGFKRLIAAEDRSGVDLFCVDGFGRVGVHTTTNQTTTLPAAFTVGVTGSVATITNITWSAGTATITATNTFTAGQRVTFYGIAPIVNGLNNTVQTVATASGSSFTVTVADPGTYTSGGKANTYTPAEGVQFGTDANAVNFYRVNNDIVQLEDSLQIAVAANSPPSAQGVGVSISTLGSIEAVKSNSYVYRAFGAAGDSTPQIRLSTGTTGASAGCKLEFGPGNGATDVSFTRTGAAALSVAGVITFSGSGTTFSSLISTGSITANGGIGFADGGSDMAFGNVTGTKIGTLTTQKIGFWNTTPKVQPTAITARVASITDSSGGTSSDTIAAIEATYTQATIRNAFATAAAKINNLTSRVNDLESRLNANTSTGLGLIAGTA